MLGYWTKLKLNLTVKFFTGISTTIITDISILKAPNVPQYPRNPLKLYPDTCEREMIPIITANRKNKERTVSLKR